MYCCISYTIIGYKFTFGIAFYMVFVSEMSFIALLCPFCICVLLSQFCRIFDNYLSNAVYHTPAGGEIRITLREFNNALRLSVFNSGDRIPDDMRGKIWIEAFTTKDEISEKNAGLGLYIVKEISLLEDTDCGFFNRPDGVEFWFDFIGLE